MTSRPASPTTLSLIAQIGALGESLSGVRALLWLVRLMLSLRVDDGPNAPAAGLWAMLWRIATGRLKLRGFDVTERVVHRGSSRTQVVRIAMRGAPGEPCVFSVSVEFVDDLAEDFVPWRCDTRPMPSVVTTLRGDFAKLGLELSALLRLFCYDHVTNSVASRATPALPGPFRGIYRGVWR